MPLNRDQTRALLQASVDPEDAGSVQLRDEVYADLRRMAEGCMSRERADHTLQATALVHEAYVRMADHPNLDDASRTRFMVIAAGEMRRVLIDHARKRDAVKRGNGWKQVTLSGIPITDDGTCEAAALAEALEGLGRLSPRQLRVVELRFFSGLRMREIAEVLGLSLATAEDDWYAARAWLLRALSGEEV